MKLSYGIAGLLLMVLIAYFNAVPGVFHYDDFPLLLENPRVTSPTFDPEVFIEQYGGRPLTLLVFNLEHRIWGRQPVPFHLTNIALHALNVILLFLLLIRMGSSRLQAAASAAIFAVHPLQAQAVNYIWARSSLMMASFALTSLLLCRVRPGWSILSFQLAVWSRAEALIVAIPLLLRNSKLRLPILGLALVNLTSILYGLAESKPAQVAWSHSSPLVYWSLFAWGWLKYLGMMLWPVGYSIHHSLPDPPVPILILAWIILLGLIFLSIYLLKVRPAIGMGLLWSLLFLTPSLSVPNSDLINDSRAYLALAGIAFTGGALLFGSTRKVSEFCLDREMDRTEAINLSADLRLPMALFVALLLPLLAQTWRWNKIWRDDVRIWEVAVAEAADDVSHYNLGAAMVRDGEIELAEKQFQTASQLNPADDMSYAGLGYCAEYREAWIEALDLYKKSLQLNPGNDYARLGIERIRSIVPRHKDEP